MNTEEAMQFLADKIWGAIGQHLKPGVKWTFMAQWPGEPHLDIQISTDTPEGLNELITRMSGRAGEMIEVRPVET